MKRTLLLSVMILVLSCADNVEKNAQKHLDTAHKEFSSGNYNIAKQEIDSIRILYPKAFETRRQAIKLM